VKERIKAFCPVDDGVQIFKKKEGNVYVCTKCERVHLKLDQKERPVNDYFD